MSADRSARIESLFHAAMALPPERQRAFLESSDADPEIREAVERLLGHARSDAGDDRLETLIARARPAAPARRIGPYRLLRELGSGGMGTVYLAERDLDGTVQRVALKLLHGLPGEREKRRLVRERELLAGLGHPYIAALVDGGETADGQPYLVMNYVEGQALADYLAARRPALAERLRLFAQCCEAVQHAHQRLVLHRDIKPSNILIGSGGTPVLLDFGVAGSLETAESERTLTLAYTPGYAAPEQLHGLAATTATDVFGLGTLLFDMLSGTRLSALRKGDAAVPAPSTHIRDPALRRAVRGDLDRIVLKATAADPAERYPAVAALADDIDRFQRGEPLMAGPDAPGYRLRKFVARHRWGVAAGLAAVLIAGTFVWRLDTERQRATQAEAAAQREAASASASRDFLVSVLGAADPEALRGRPATLETLLAMAMDKLRDDTRLDPHARALGWLTIADVYAKVRDPQRVLEAVRRGEAASRAAGIHDPELEARMLELRGSALSDLERHDEAVARMRALVALRASQPEKGVATVRAYRGYAMTMARAHRFAPAEARLHEALELLDEVELPDAERLRLGLLIDGMDMQSMQGDYAAADGYLRQVRGIAARLLAPDDLQWLRIRNAAADIRLNQARYAEALEEAQQAMAVVRKVYGERNRRIVAQEQKIASIHYQLGREREAIAHLENARRLSGELRLGDVVMSQLDIELATNRIAWGQHRDGIRALDAALARLPADDPAQSIWRMAAHGLRAGAHAALGEFEHAWPDHETELAMSLEFGADSFEHAQAQLRYARTLLEAGRLQESGRALATTRRANRKHGIGADTPAGVVVMMVGAQLQQALGNGAAAQEEIARALQAASVGGGEIAPKTRASVALAAAEIALEQGQVAHARRLLEQALPTLEQTLWPGAVQLRKARALARRIEGGTAPGN